MGQTALASSRQILQLTWRVRQRAMMEFILLILRLARLQKSLLIP